MLSATIHSTFLGQLIANREDGQGLAGRKSGRLYRSNSRAAILEALKAGNMSKKELTVATGLCFSIIGRMADAMAKAGEIRIVELRQHDMGGRRFPVFGLVGVEGE